MDFDVVFLDLLLPDAIDKNDGLIKHADKGILFLDELGELSPAAQKSILRVFQNKTFLPLGMNKELNCDFRLISATKRDLQAMVEQGVENTLGTDETGFPSLKDFRLLNKSQYLDALVRLSGGRIEKACTMAGVSRSGLYPPPAGKA
ncbi:MAG: sigma 54-interacting transcriptional regulator [Desulfobacter postgatei]|uniref:sigma 54-interacting transcriptional regulator n=1 Tax=Desulfobacter postgatei TaxID=2293 RepID=UPI0023F370D7|nr:sigma 54-interacting transcriptional regulator [Desulfobacter postgatei]MDD4273794.1 sigma 54-interacting transcriptional regulator [Desulfobacter postgatei]